MRLLSFSVVSDSSHPGAKQLAASAKFWGWDHKFIVLPTGWDRFTYRNEQLGALEFLRTLEPEYVLYLDGWDTVFTGPPQELPLRPGKLTFGGDKLCWPNSVLAPQFPEVFDGRFRFVNAGTYWGDAFLVRQLAEEFLALDSPSLSNQDFFNARYLYEDTIQSGRLSIDSSAEVSLNVHGMDPFFSECGYKHRRVWYKPTDTFPLVVHSPGKLTETSSPPFPVGALHG